MQSQPLRVALDPGVGDGIGRAASAVARLAPLILRELAAGQREHAPVRRIGVGRRILNQVGQGHDAGAEQHERRRDQPALLEVSAESAIEKQQQQAADHQARNHDGGNRLEWTGK